MSQYASHAWFFSGALAIFALAGTATLSDRAALAQTDSHACHLLTSAESIPQGFGAAYNLFSAAKEPLVKVDCGSSSDAVLTVGDGQQNMYVYRFGYEWTGTQWSQIALNGSQRIANDWYLGSAKANLSRSQIQLAEDNFVVTYSCLWHQNAWKCGCRDQSCTSNHWQLQAFRQATPSSGETVGSGSTIPAAIRSVNVSNNSQLSSAISDAQPGDHIILAKGAYSGFTIARSGQSGKPIVVRAADVLEAKVSGCFDISGDHVWVVGLDVTATSTCTIQGTRDRVTRSRFRGDGAGVEVTSSARYAEVDHNEIGPKGLGADGSGRAIRASYSLSVKSGYNHHFYRNYVHDLTETGDIPSAIVSSSNGHMRAHNTGTVIEYNLVSNWIDGRSISIKSGGNIVRFNTIIDSAQVNVRVGANNQIIANWIEGNKGVTVCDIGNSLIGNRVNGASIQLCSGNLPITGDNLVNNGYVPATDTVVAGNNGALRVGFIFNTYNKLPAENTRIETHTGPITFGLHKNTIHAATTNSIIPQAFKITPSQVGPFAPTAPSF
jgi:hypothetical protein